MKVITIIQPWATLIALREKKFETRSWSTKHRGELAIHAGKKVDKEACLREPFKSTLAKYGYNADNLPTGVILARCILRDCIEVVWTNGEYAILGISTRTAGGNEYAFGDFSQGRYAWEVSDIDEVDPIPVKGQQGLWNYPL
jgi:hypothetical protein